VGERVIPESQTLYPEGKILSLWGDNRPWNYSSWLLPLPIKWQAEEVRFGTQWAWNWQRYVAQYHEREFMDEFGIWTAIANCDRVIHHHSTAPGYLPMPRIDNGARALLPGGIGFPVLPEYHKSGMVSYRVRNYRMEGVEPPLVSRWQAIHNRARLIQPLGYVASRFGTGLLENTRRNFRYITAGDQQIIPVPMIAYRIRGITFESRYGIQPPAIPEQGIKLRVRYLSTIGLESNRFGAAFLEIHWTKFAPMWIHRDLFGEARVKNLTPELHGYGHNSELFGDAFVRLEWRALPVESFIATQFSGPLIAYRTKILTPSPVFPVKVGDKLKVERTGPYIPEPQWITQIRAHGYDKDYYPVPDTNDHGFGKTALWYQFAYVIEEVEQTLFGKARVTANTIRVIPGYQTDPGTSPVVTGGNLRITVSPYSMEHDLEHPPSCRVSPHTLWVTEDAPLQAKENHPGQTYHLVDTYTPKGMGRPTATLRHRVIHPFYLDYNGFPDFSRLGKPELTLRLNYLYPDPIGIPRMGYPAFLGYDQTVNEEGYVSSVFGEAEVKPGPYLGDYEVKVEGFKGIVSKPDVMHFHRPIYPLGFDAARVPTSFSESHGPNTPYAWQYLHVGPPMPTLPEGIDSEKFGSQWVSLAIRDLFVPGTDFSSAITISIISKRE